MGFVVLKLKTQPSGSHWQQTHLFVKIQFLAPNIGMWLAKGFRLQHRVLVLNDCKRCVESQNMAVEISKTYVLLIGSKICLTCVSQSAVKSSAHPLTVLATKHFSLNKRTLLRDGPRRERCMITTYVNKCFRYDFRRICDA